MKTKRPALEWQIADGEGTDHLAWQIPAGPTSSSLSKTKRAPRVARRDWASQRWPELAGLIALVVLLGGWLLGPTSEEVRPVEPITAEAAETMRVNSPLVTTYFIVHFHPQHATPVQAIAAQLDRRYEALRQELWLGLLPIEQRIEIRVGYAQTTSAQLFPPTHRERLLVIPTEFLPATGSPEVETALARYIENWLAGRMLDEAGERAAILPRWQSMLKAFKYLFWLRQRSDGVLRSEWVYLARLNPLPAAPTVSAAATAQPGYEAAYLDESLRDFAVTISLADYLLATYGRQRLPALLAGFGRYDSWNELSPTIFGLEASALEANWHTYLEQVMRDSKPARSLPACRASSDC